MSDAKFTKPFAEWLEQTRISQGKTQEDLAECIGIDTSRIKAWENGKGFPRLSNATKLAVCLDIPLEERGRFHHFATGKIVPGKSHPRNLDPIISFQETSMHARLLRSAATEREFVHTPNLVSQQRCLDWPIVMSNPLHGEKYRWKDSGYWGDNEDSFGVLYRSIVDDWYRMEVIPKSNKGSGWGGMMFHPTHGTFYVAVDIIQPEPHPGNSCGIMFGAINNANYQIFSVRAFEQEYLVSGVRDDINWSSAPNVVPTYSRLIQRDGVNRLAILAENTHFTFYVNSIMVGTCIIEDLPGNAVDVVVIAREDLPAIGMFANFELREPPSNT